jgi:hypothetical protein
LGLVVALLEPNQYVLPVELEVLQLGLRDLQDLEGVLVSQSDEVHLFDLPLKEVSEDLLLKLVADTTNILPFEQKLMQLFDIKVRSLWRLFDLLQRGLDLLVQHRRNLDFGLLKGF